MQQVTIGRKYQLVIPKAVRKDMKGLKPGTKVAVVRLNETTLAVKTKPADWIIRAAGLMTEVWKNTDPIKELRQTKRDWEKRLADFEQDLK